MIQSHEKDGYLIIRTIMEGEAPKKIEMPILKESVQDSTQEKEALKKWWQFWKRG